MKTATRTHAEASHRRAADVAAKPQGNGVRRSVNDALERLAHLAAHWSSSSAGFALALGVVVCWLAVGPLLGYSDSWQLFINTGTTIITFLMVFLIQRSQSKDALAIQLKLDEIVAALAGASNRLVAVEDLSESELAELQERYEALSRRASHLANRGVPLSVDAPARAKRRNGEHRKRRTNS